MERKLAICVIHGIGSPDPGFADEMIEEIDSRVAGSGHDAGAIVWKTIHWSDVLEFRQRAYLDAARRSAELDYLRLRRFVIEGLGDAAAYHRNPTRHASTYERIHARIREALAEVYEQPLGRRAAPLIFLAHSLGSYIVSNYIWDVQHAPSRAGGNAFERLETLSGIVSFGSTIPLHVLAYDEIVPIVFPPQNLPARLRRKARWLNFYDPDDVLGYPLRPINAAYRRVVHRDIAINVGGLGSSWNPRSHSRYWTDDDFTRAVARFVTSFL
ncbi:MAG: hypothetical protein ACE5FG_02140 [Myxococcota bacterium]